MALSSAVCESRPAYRASSRTATKSASAWSRPSSISTRADPVPANPPNSADSLDRPLSSLKGIGPTRHQQLASAGLRTLGDLLEVLPIGYRDFSSTTRPSAIECAGEQAIEGRLAKLRWVRRRGRRGSMVLGELTDGAASVALVWPSQPWQKKRLEGLGEVVLFGKVESTARGWRMLMPKVMDAAMRDQVGPQPFYPDLPGLGQTLAQRLRGQALDALQLQGLEDWLPKTVRQGEALIDLESALLEVHLPAADAELAALQTHQTAGWRRLLWGDLVEQQLYFLWRRSRFRHRRPVGVAPACPESPSTGQVLATIPFELTRAQLRVAEEIRLDLAARRPMRRLLTGDVGCGKTVVLALAIEQVLAQGTQAVLMAPTEVLAEQHFEHFRELLPDCSSSLLTSSVEDSAVRRQQIAEGSVSLVIGTHALIQPNVSFANLELAVIDEQHRFGVDQRRALLRKGQGTGLLATSATPIPRSLALAAFGDFDLSVIDELPCGRSPIRTEVLDSSDRAEAYLRLRQRVEQGEQAFVVLPRIEEAAGVPSLEQRSTELKALLEPLACGTLSGRTPAEERRAILARFTAGELRVLIATTVIEVGVDIPAATVIVIEGAERFGLAQLHQLRGRVGRGSEPAICLALHGPVSDAGRRRLAAFAATTDGFELARTDLLQRGAGELVGQRQSGLQGVSVNAAMRDPDLLLRARQAAEKLRGDFADRRSAEVPTAALRRRLAARLWAERRTI